MRDPHNAGDNHQSELEAEAPELEAGSKPLTMPRKADLASGSQARRLREFQQANRRPGSARAQQLPAEPQERQTEAGRRTDGTRLSSPHPRSAARRRGESPFAGLGRAFHSLTSAISVHRERVASAPGLEPAALKQAVLRRPSRRGGLALVGMGTVLVIVAGMLLTLPSQPGTPSASGSIYGVKWHAATKLPMPKLDYGPYFVSYGTDTLMVGTVLATKDGKTTSTTSVWASEDGLNWSQRSGGGSFDVGDRRFVPQGISDDGSGGLVVVGNSVVPGTTDVAASAWHSRDGSSWNSMSVDGGKGQQMVGGSATHSGTIVAAGNGVVWSCTDGVSWSAQVLPNATGFTLKVVSSWDGGFLIVGLWTGGGITRKPGSAVWHSSSGRDWSQPTPLDGFDVRGVAAIGKRIVLAGTDTATNAPGLAASWSSTDGSAWTKATAPVDDLTVSLDGVVAVNGTFLAYGAPAVIANPNPTPTPKPTPTPEATPTPTPSPTPAPTDTQSPEPTDSGAASPKTSPTPSPKPSPSASPSAAEPSASPSPTAKPTGAPVTTPTPPVSEFVWVSDDGLNWLPVDSTAAPLGHGRIIAHGSDLVFIGRGYNGALAASSGTVVMGVARSTSVQSAAPGQFTLTLQAGNTPMIADLTKNDVMGPVAGSKDRYVIFVTGPVGTSIWSSPTGSLWSQEADPDALTAKGTTGRPVILQAIADGQGGIIATGKVTNDQGDNGVIWHMTPGKGWHQVTIQDDAPPEISSITAGAGGFVASSDVAGGSKILYSADGETWQAGAINVSDSFSLSVASYKDGYVAVGSDASRNGVTTAWTSPDGRTWTIRAGWRLPANVTQLFGVGNGFVAVAITPAVAAAPTPQPTPTPTPAKKPTVAPKPTATPVPAGPTYTWYWSQSGVIWQASGLVTSGGDVALVNGELLVIDSPPTAGKNWGFYTSSDGKTWQHPTLSGDLPSFTGSKVCGISSVQGHVAIIGTDGPGKLKDYFGRLDSH